MSRQQNKAQVMDEENEFDQGTPNWPVLIPILLVMLAIVVIAFVM